MNRTSKLTILALVAAFTAFGQPTPSYVDGQVSALNFAFGQPNSGVKGGQGGALFIGIGSENTGSVTYTLDFGQVVTRDGIAFSPISTSIPLSIGGPTNAETATPSAVSCSTPTVYQTCTITVSVSNAHRRGEPIRSADFGLTPAIAFLGVPASGQSTSGVVVLGRNWRNAGGLTSTITGVTYNAANVWILDRSLNGSGTLYGKPDRSTGAYTSTNNDRSFQLTLSSGTASRTLAWTYTAGPQCVASKVSGTLSGVVAMTSTVNTVTATSSNGSDNAVLNISCQPAQ